MIAPSMSLCARGHGLDETVLQIVSQQRAISFILQICKIISFVVEPQHYLRFESGRYSLSLASISKGPSPATPRFSAG